MLERRCIGNLKHIMSRVQLVCFTYGEMQLWRNCFVGACEYIRYEGKHFFIRQHHSEMAEVIRSRMDTYGRQSK